MAHQLPPELLRACQTNYGPVLIALGWVFLSIAIIAVLLRLYFRHFHRSGIHLDDWVMLASLVCVNASLLVCLVTDARARSQA